MGIVVTSATDVGQRRENNEDSHVVWKPQSPEELADKGVFMLVADGMGGSQGGEVASRMATESVLKHYRDSKAESAQALLAEAVERANAEIYERSVRETRLQGMGTTCTALVIRGGNVYYAHVGDSRAYLVRGSEVRQLTDDHSLVAQLVRDRHLTEEQARVDPRRNVVTRSVGVGEHLQIDAEQLAIDLQEGDTFVICSDGLHGVVGDEEIGRLASGDSLSEACRSLIDLANSRGGPDNITVIIARIENLPDTKEFDRAEIRALDDDPGSDQRPSEAVHAPRDVSGDSSAGGGRSTAALTWWIVPALVVLSLILWAVAVLVAQIRDESRRVSGAGRLVSVEGTSAR